MAGMPLKRRILLALSGGPMAGASLVIPVSYPSGWAPPDVVWASRDADGEPVCLQPDKQLLNAIAARARAEGLGWVPYRRDVDEPVVLRHASAWRYGWDRAMDPAQSPRRLRVAG